MPRKSLLLLCAVLLLALAALPAWGLATEGEARSVYRGFASGKGYQYVHFGQFPFDEDGTVRPLLWRVLSVEDGKVYLLSEYVIEAKQVHHAWETYGEWLETDLYAYLNQDFLHRAFSEEEQEWIVTSASPGTVFLPSYEDLSNPDYGFGKNKSREGRATEYGKANGLFSYSGGVYSPYWSRTRDPHHDGSTRRVLSEGALGYIRAIVSDLGIRPGVYLDESLLPAHPAGEGTEASPFVLTEGGIPSAQSESPGPIASQEAPEGALSVHTLAPEETPDPVEETPAQEEEATPVPTEEPTPEPTPEPAPVATASPRGTPTPVPEVVRHGEVTFDAYYSVPGDAKAGIANILDRDLTTRWQNKNAAILEIESDTPCFGLYILWSEMPQPWQVQVPDGEYWKTVATSEEGAYLHEYLPLDGLTHFRILPIQEEKARMDIAELYLIDEGEVPDWVQRWEPTVEKADLMVLAAHPDDEFLYMGGSIPTYAGELQMDVLVVIMTHSNRVRRNELLNALWVGGLRTYPLWSDFPDQNFSGMYDAYKNWGFSATREFITDIYRKYRPEVVITHDPKGEYGHSAHQLCADVSLYCLDAAINPDEFPESYELYGPWQVKKLYYHLGEENRITMNWRVDLPHFDGRTALEVAQAAYQEHVSQLKNSHFQVTDEGKYSCAVFGLVRSTVGEDVEKNDFMENIPWSEDRGERPVMPTPAPISSYFPPLTEEGFLREGEFVYQDGESGIWLYASPTLRIVLERRSDSAIPLVWYEVEVWAAPEEIFHVVQLDPEVHGKRYTMPHLISQQGRSVFSLTTDYYNYRINRNIQPGVVLRGGEIISEKTFRRDVTRFPNLDVMAILPDGSLRTFHNDEHTGQEYLDMGAKDVLSFGPILIQDGEVNAFVYDRPGSLNPRIALGMVEPGHYICILAEGRFRDESVGTDLVDLAEMMLEKGCVEALNLDGGQTAALVFLGEQVSRIASYNGGNTSPRDAYEVLSIGTSELTTVFTPE